MKSTTVSNDRTPHLNLRRACLLILVVGACYGLLSVTQAVSPPPDGGYIGANTAEGGAGALFSLTTGTNNTALGSQALFSLTTGNQNTATGAQALKNNIADNNTADGFQALAKNTTGSNNTATGWRTLFQNTTGDANSANGVQALYRNTMGTGNTAIGFQALFNNTTGNQNAAVGEDALSTNTTGHDNIALGYGCGGNITTGSNNIDIGNRGSAADESTIRIGTGQSATFIAGIFGTSVIGSPVAVDSDGHLGVGVVSSARFKDDVRPMNKASEALFALEPVTFRYKKQLDPKGMSQFGLVAEEVEKVNPDLVLRDKQGKPYSVRYDAVNAMLLNEFLKEHRTVQEQQKEIAALRAELNEQRAFIQQVNDKVELNRGAAQTVTNNH